MLEKLTKTTILEKMRAGERLRWISREEAGLDDSKIRDLYLGRRKLTKEEGYLVVQLDISGRIVDPGDSVDVNNTRHVIEYELVGD